jgi:nitrite reductase (NADH) small subunit/3-phenylpropionate/trans-cinnamate dioxygenase ferredoxin subunit
MTQPQSEFVTVAVVGQVPAGRGRAFQVGDRWVAVFFVDGQYYALNDACPHMGASLALGDVRNGAVVCDRHLWAFRLNDGVCPDAPALRAEVYPVRIVGEEIQVALPQSQV